MPGWVNEINPTMMTLNSGLRYHLVNRDTGFIWLFCGLQDGGVVSPLLVGGGHLVRVVSQVEVVQGYAKGGNGRWTHDGFAAVGFKALYLFLPHSVAPGSASQNTGPDDNRPASSNGLDAGSTARPRYQETLWPDVEPPGSVRYSGRCRDALSRW